jgi:rhomboid protease GluP
MQVEVEHDGERWSLDALALEEEVRAGRLPGEARVRHPDWTGAAFGPIAAVPALADALNAPAARFAAHLRAPPLPWAMSLTTLLLCLLCIAQTLAGATAPARTEDLLRATAMGLSTTLLDGAWWTVWTSHLVHAPAFPLAHLVANLAFLLYSGFRVERALGGWGYAAVMAAAAAGSSLLVVGAGQPPTIGSSTLAFGLWAAQVGIGVRLGEAMPAGLRRRYGLASFFVVAPLLALNLMVEGVSHLGHLGGALGGLLVAMAAPVPGTLPPDRRAQARRRLAGLTGLALVLPPAGAALGNRAGAEALLWRRVEVALPGGDSAVLLPAGMAEQAVRAWGIEGWQVADLDQAVFMGGEWRARSFPGEALPGEGAEEARRAWWADRTRQELHPAEAPAPLGPGWSAAAWTLTGGDGAPLRLVEHSLARGLHHLRIAWVLDTDAPDGGRARERFFTALARSVRVGDPAGVRELREAQARNPASPRLRFEAAEALFRLGEAGEADALLLPLLDRTDGWDWEAARLRLRNLAAQPSSWPAPPDPRWLEPFLRRAPLGDAGIHLPALRWLAAQGRCAEARAHHARLRALAEEAGERLDAELERALAPCAPGEEETGPGGSRAEGPAPPALSR